MLSFVKILINKIWIKFFLGFPVISLTIYLLIFSTIFSFFNLTSITPKLVFAQDSQTENSNQNFTSNLNQNSSLAFNSTSSPETAFADINQIGFDDSNYHFGDRIEPGKFSQTQIKNDICGQNLDFSNSKSTSNSSQNSAPKFDPNSASTVIKTLKTKCKNSQFSNQNSAQNSVQNSNPASQSWLKLVWDNGLVGWVEISSIPKISQSKSSNSVTNSANNSNLQNTSQNSTPSSNLNSAISTNSVQNSDFILNTKTSFDLINILQFGSIQTLAQTNTDLAKTCSDFQFQVRDLSLLNQFPNFDLDDDGVGCEHLPINPNDQIAEDISGFDTDKNGKITCADFEQIIYDPIILARFPNLDTDKDSVGCENNKVNLNYKSFESFDNSNSEDFVDIEKQDFELTLDENTVDLVDLTKELTQTLNADWQYLEGNEQSCSNIICPIQSLSGLGRKGLWTFHFVTGLLQGAGQSVVDLLGQIWNLVTKPGETINGIINSIKALFGDSKILLKLVHQDSMLELLKTDTMGRANLIGKAVGQFVPDVILAFLTAGVGNIAKNSLTALKT
jgi:hypothetical protein